MIFFYLRYMLNLKFTLTLTFVRKYHRFLILSCTDIFFQNISVLFGAPVAGCLASPMYLPISAPWGSLGRKKQPCRAHLHICQSSTHNCDHHSWPIIQPIWPMQFEITRQAPKQNLRPQTFVELKFLNFLVCWSCHTLCIHLLCRKKNLLGH